MDLDQFCRRLEHSLIRPEGSISPDLPFAEIPKFDSMSQIEVILLMDELYGVQVPEQVIPTLTCVRDLAPLVEQAREVATS